MSVHSRRVDRRRLLLAGAGLASTAWLAACGSSDDDKGTSNATPAATAAAAATTAATQATASDLNEKGWPKSLSKLELGVIPLEDRVQQQNTLKPLTDFISTQIGVPVDVSITISYVALVEAQRNKQVTLGYYGPFNFLFAEQRFGAVPILIDSPDGKTPGKYNSYLLAGKDSPVKTVEDIKGKDFSFVDPQSASGNLFPRAMLIEAGIDPNKDVKGRFAGNHQNSLLAIAKGQVPCGASNNLSLDSAVSRGIINKDDIVILKVSPDIPNGPYAVHPDLDKRAAKKMQEAFGGFTDREALKKLELVGPLIPTDTSTYNFVRQTAKLLNLEFDEKGAPKPVGG